MLLLNFLTVTQLLHLYCYSPNSGISPVCVNRLYRLKCSQYYLYT